MRCPGALAVLLAGLTLPLSAQRGGFRGGGSGAISHSGGFNGGRGFVPAPHASVAYPRPGLPRPGFPTPARTYRSWRIPYSAQRYGLRTEPRFYGGGLRAPGNFHRNRPVFSPVVPWGGRRHGGYIYPGFLASGFAYPGFFDFGFLDPFWDDPNPYGYDQSLYAYSRPYGGDAPASPDAYPPVQQQAADGYAVPDAEQNGAVAGDPETDRHGPLVYAPGAPEAYEAQGAAVSVQNTPQEEDALVLFFRDGRPPEQIRNYALTRTTLLITDGRLREIPLDELNIPLTEKVNRALGIDFRLPEKQ